MKLSVKTIAYTAVFSALCCVATLIIIIPLPNGYVNLGDIFVLLSGWCLGPLYGALASSIGCMIADIISGYVAYAPVTFFVKGAVSVCSYLIWALVIKAVKNKKLDFIIRLVSAVIGEIVMVLGYFVYESVLYGIPGGALALLGNSVQGLICAVGGVLLVVAMSNVKYFNTIFPLLKKE